MFERLEDCKFNIILGTTGSGKTAVVSLLINKLLEQKNDIKIVIISEFKKEQYKTKLYKFYNYLHNYKSLFNKNVEKRLSSILGEKIFLEIEPIKFLENIKYLSIYDISKKEDIHLISNSFDYVFIDSIDSLGFEFNSKELLNNIKSKIFITKCVKRISTIDYSNNIVYSLSNELVNHASIIFETKVENRNLDLICLKNKYGELDKITLPLYNILC